MDDALLLVTDSGNEILLVARRRGGSVMLLVLDPLQPDAILEYDRVQVARDIVFCEAVKVGNKGDSFLLKPKNRNGIQINIAKGICPSFSSRTKIPRPHLAGSHNPAPQPLPY